MQIMENMPENVELRAMVRDGERGRKGGIAAKGAERSQFSSGHYFHVCNDLSATHAESLMQNEANSEGARGDRQVAGRGERWRNLAMRLPCALPAQRYPGQSRSRMIELCLFRSIRRRGLARWPTMPPAS